MHRDDPDYRVVDMSLITVVKLHIRARKLVENFGSRLYSQEPSKEIHFLHPVLH